ncbi:MAG: PQQ-binding-like beta-propeller repeat protein, partial [Anaerolineae bacterium]|nr:PQQ-binding-like beta-propeller repeat protein [Anaerolineae bacterium]
MRNKRRISYLSTVFAFAILGLFLSRLPIEAQTNDPIPPEVANHEVEWPLPNRDYANTRSAVESPIDSTSVNTLQEAWTFAIPGTGPYGAAASNPVVVDQTVYFEDLASNIHAINLEDGSVRWQRNFNETAYGPNGPVVAYGKVFAVVGTSNLAAINAEDGSILWNVRLTEGDVEGITIQPSVYDGLVYVSTVPGSSDQNFYQGGVAGILYALDQETGEIVWEFNTVASDDLWGYAEINSGGGAWYPPAIDTTTGDIFFGIGNPGPWPGTEEFPNGTSHPGANLYTNSMLSLDHASGELQWFQQVLPHDLFDLDLQISPILATIDRYGESRDVVIGAGKMGRVYAFDRATGDILWQTAVGEHQNDMLDQLPEGEITEVLPGPLGGVETPMAMANDGMIYVPVVNLPGYYEPGRFVDDRFNFSNATGELVAIDGNTGKIMWQVNFDTMNIGAATVVNDLVFTATNDGMIYAFDRYTGEQKWSWQAPAGINGWPAVVGETIIWPAGQGENPTLVALRLSESAATSTSSESTACPEAPSQQGTTVAVTETSYNIELDQSSAPAGDVTFQI